MKLLKEAVFTVNTEIDENATDEDLVRIALSAEISAINLYKALAKKTPTTSVKNLLLDLASEEQIHAGELQQLLEFVDSTEIELHNEGRNEANTKIKEV